jgi:hypothetical protein
VKGRRVSENLIWTLLIAALAAVVIAVAVYRGILLTPAPVPSVEKINPRSPDSRPDNEVPPLGPPAPLVDVSGWGEFVGRAILETVDEDGTDEMFILLEDLTYVDRHGRRWTAKKGLKTNGASIPRFLWTVMGSPMTGAYRRAAFVHDQECVEPTASTADVNKMFYAACRCGGTPDVDARWMFWAVSQYGPRWTFEDGKAVFQVRYMAAPDDAAMRARDFIREHDVPLDELADMNLSEMIREGEKWNLP